MDGIPSSGIHRPAGLFPKPPDHLPVFQQTAHGGIKPLFIPFLRLKAVDAVQHHIRGSGIPVADRSQTAGHAFQQNVPESFRLTGEQQNVHGGIMARQVFPTAHSAKTASGNSLRRLFIMGRPLPPPFSCRNPETPSASACTAPGPSPGSFPAPDAPRRQIPLHPARRPMTGAGKHPSWRD